jgi:DNA-binding GntR family transcriptional regulator
MRLEMAGRSKAKTGEAPLALGAAGAGKASRGEWVYESIRSAIQEGKYRGGDRIREEEVAQALGVSRTPVREGLSRLQARGLLEVSPAGLVVAVLSAPQVIELYAMREILEGSAARFAAQHASPSEIAMLKALNDAFAKASSGPSVNPAKLAQINRQFHAAIHEAAHNRYLMRTLTEAHDSLALLPSTTFAVPGRPEIAVGEHQSIIRAIEKRDAEAAERRAREHIRNAQEVRFAMMFETA